MIFVQNGSDDLHSCHLSSRCPRAFLSKNLKNLLPGRTRIFVLRPIWMICLAASHSQWTFLTKPSGLFTLPPFYSVSIQWWWSTPREHVQQLGSYNVATWESPPTMSHGSSSGHPRTPQISLAMTFSHVKRLSARSADTVMIGREKQSRNTTINMFPSCICMR